MRFYNMKEHINIFIYISFISLSQGYAEIKKYQNFTSLYAIEGEPFSLNCTTSCPENNGVKLSWEYLSLENNRKIDAVILNCEEKIKFINISVVNATKEHEGGYLCVSTNDKGIPSTLNITKVYVGKPVLEISTDEKLHMPHGTEQISLTRSFVIKDYPPINNWYLLKDGKEIFNEKKVKFNKKTIITDEGPITFFKVTVNSLTVIDTANYTIVVSNGYCTKNLTYEIRRKGISTVNIIEDDKKRYHIGDTITLRCEIVGYPLVPAKWYFSDRNEVSIENEKFVKESLINAISSIQFKLLNSTDVTCQVEKINDTKMLLAYEVNHGFHIIGPNRPWYPEGYNITIACLASRYDFKNLSWKSNEKLINMTKHSETFLSHVVTLEINNISVTQSALYQCIGIRLNGSSEARSIPIIIAGMHSPQIKDNRNNNTYVGILQPLRLSCYANAIPEPHIEWLKDNIILTNDSNVEIYEKISNWTEVKSTLDIKQVQDKDLGTYVCKATNQNGEKTKLYNVILKVSDNTIDKMLIAATAPIIVILSIFVLYLIRLVRKEKQFKRELKAAGLYFFDKGNPESLNPDLFIDDQAELLPYDPSFEFPRQQLILGQQLGSGAFGVVYKATASALFRTSKTSIVAAKVAKKTMDNVCIKALISELKIMMHLGKHLNIVNLLGACTKHITRRELIVIVEYCRFGNIRTYMLKHRKTFVNQLTTYKEIQRRCRSISCSSGSSGIQSDDLNSYEDQFTEYTTLSKSGNTANTLDRQDSAYDSDGSFHEQSTRPLSSRDLLCWAFQIARGMEYLASRKVLHGDLAARNILLAEDNIVKICDFGLSRSLYKNEEYMKKSESPLPFKWLAIECMIDKIFSIQSDIWSFGIVLWEIFSLGKTPYPSIGVENIIKWLLRGNRLEKPLFADNRLYRIMLKCWVLTPTLRPSFTQLQEELGNFLEDNVRNYYTELNGTYVDLNKMREGQKDYLDMVSVPNYNNIVTPSSHHYINEVVTKMKPREIEGNDVQSTTNIQIEVNPRLQELKFDFDIKRLEAIYDTQTQDPKLTPKVTVDSLPTRSDSESDYERSLTPCTIPHEETYLDEVFEQKDNNLKLLENNFVNNPTYLIYNMCSRVGTQSKVQDNENVTNCKPSQYSCTPEFVASDHVL